MLSRLAAIAAALVFAITATQRARAEETFTGHSVVVTGQQPLQAYLRDALLPDGSIRFDLWEVSRAGIVRNYDWDMTKIMHMIVVSDDLAHFDHIHPALQADGHLTIDYKPPESGLYHVYVDGIPHGLGRQVFRFDVPSGSGTPAAARTLHAPGAVAQAGPYTVRLDPVSIPFGEVATIDVNITENGRPARDLHPYLGMMAHGVFIGATDLAYMHAHGMSEEMLSMASANDCGDGMLAAMQPLVPSATIDSHFEFEVLAPSSQNYDFWLQFVGGTTLYTVPFLVTTR